MVEYRKGTKDVFISLGGLSTGKPKKSREERVWKDTFWHLPLSSSCVYSPYFRNNTQVVKEAKKPAWGRRERGGEGKGKKGTKKKLFQSAFFLLLSSCGGWQWPEKERDPLNPKWTLSRHPTPTFSLFPFLHWLREKGAKNGGDEDVGRGGEGEIFNGFFVDGEISLPSLPPVSRRVSEEGHEDIPC